MVVKNAKGREILLAMVNAVHENKQYLSDIDGLIGDGDHGMNMNKGFVTYGERLGDGETSFTDGLTGLGMVLLNEIGGSMGPIYGTVFMEMADAAEEAEDITLEIFGKMLSAGLDGLYDIVDARPGDKTLIDTLNPCVEYIKNAAADHHKDYSTALDEMAEYAEQGKESTRDMVAMYGRASRLGERSKGVLDAGAVSCCIILKAMAEGMKKVLE